MSAPTAPAARPTRPEAPAPAGLAGVDLFVTAIARAIQRHQAYPADSPLWDAPNLASFSSESSRRAHRSFPKG